MRRSTLVVLVALTLPAMAMPGLVAADGMQEGNGTNPCVGTMEERPDENTVVSMQGTRLTDDGYEKWPAMLMSYEPNGSFDWAHNASLRGRWFAYDVDRTPDGDLLFVTTESGNTKIGKLDPGRNEYEWVRDFDGDPDDESTPQVDDAHDADRLNDHEIVIADKGEGHERLLVYNVTSDEVVWEWRFEDHAEQFPESGGGPEGDWTHVNDVDPVGDHLFMISPRNFDKVVFVNRTTGDVEENLTLGEDDNYDILNEQHNPDHLRGPDGQRTILVGDSENDRVVEYAYDAESEEWERVWTVTGLNEPRDADRLPNGNTLVSDRMGHRTVEITPEGRIVWEIYTPYETYDAERGGPGSEGPTMREVGVNGTYEAHNSANFTTEEIETCAAAMYDFAPSELDSGGSGGDGDGDGDGGIVGGTDGVAGVGGDDGVSMAVVAGVGGAVVVALGAAALAYRRRD
ncbi:hypothetical protein [Halostella litorea]|uniref:hypothetical protein n=1 Tax=Halostella litorea TaxID=2528831 RepID=UPI00109276C5|nr:hypothetical protein [Halostella litorea]